MNHTRHHPLPGRPASRPPFPPASKNPLPFLQETGGAGHDLLLLNARPDLAPRKIADAEFEETGGSATAFLQRCFAGFQT